MANRGDTSGGRGGRPGDAASGRGRGKKQPGPPGAGQGGAAPPPRRGRKQAAAERAARTEKLQAEAERGNRNLIIGTIVAVVVIAFGFVAFGWYQTQIKPLNKNVLTVGETSYSLSQLERRMRFELTQDPNLASRDFASALPDIAMNSLQQEATLLQLAGNIDVEVTDEEVDAEIRSRGGLAEDAEPTLFAEEFRQQVKASELKADEYTQFLRAVLLQGKVRNYFVFLGPTSEAQVRSRWIIFEEEDSANSAVLRMIAGEEFETLAQDPSINEFSFDDAGIVDWRPRAQLPSDEIEAFLFEDAELGERSDVFNAGGLFYIVELLSREEDRDLEDGQRSIVADRDMADWLDSQSGTLDISLNLSRDDRNRALNDVF